MRTTILIAILSLLMTAKAKAEEISTDYVVYEYELTVYDNGKPLFFDVYSTLDECLAVAGGFATYTCIPVIRELPSETTI